MAALTKADLAIEMARHFDISTARARCGVDLILDYLGERLAQGDDVRLHGFGHFSRKVRKASRGRNPRTGEAIDIPETARIIFAPSKALKARLVGLVQE